MKADFPHLIEQYELKGIDPGRPVSEPDRLRLRAAGATVPVEIDGILFLPPGGGINTAGGSAISVSRLQQTIHWHNTAESTIKENVHSVIQKLNLTPEDLPDTLCFKMSKLEDDRITVEDHDNNLRAELTYNSERTAFKGFNIRSLKPET